MTDPSPRSAPPAFRPRFTLSLLYLAVFFLAYSLLLVAPELAPLARPAGPEDEAALQRAAEATARRVMGPRLPLAFALAVATLALGAWRRWLPGIAPPEQH